MSYKVIREIRFQSANIAADNRHSSYRFLLNVNLQSLCYYNYIFLFYLIYISFLFNIYFFFISFLFNFNEIIFR